MYAHTHTHTSLHFPFTLISTGIRNDSLRHRWRPPRLFDCIFNFSSQHLSIYDARMLTQFESESLVKAYFTGSSFSVQKPKQLRPRRQNALLFGCRCQKGDKGSGFPLLQRIVLSCLHRCDPTCVCALN